MQKARAFEVLVPRLWLLVVWCTAWACGGAASQPSKAAHAAGSAGASATQAASGAGAPDAGAHVSFARDVRPLFQNCVICHHTGGVIGYDLEQPFDPVHGIVGRANDWHTDHNSPYELVVKPGSPDESFLIYKVAADPNPATFDTGNNGDPMPVQIARVTAAELTSIKQWITSGANDDDFFMNTVGPIFGTAITLGSREGKCTLCHYPGSPAGMNILAPFDPTMGLVNAPSLLSKKVRVKPGSPDDSFLIEKIEQMMPSAGAAMPLHYPRLTSAEVDVLRRWIAQGANDD